MTDLLPAEIADALAGIGLRAVRGEPITTLTTPLHRRAVYRVVLDSGESIKARRLEDEATARALCELRRELPAAFVPVRARHERVVVEPWIDGVDLRDRPPDEGLLTAAAALLASLHRLTTVSGRNVRSTGSTAGWRAECERALGVLERRAALPAPVLERLGSAVARLDPNTAVVGLVHTDFCGENLVVDAAGALHVIDNERISVDALAYDLGRTWARWSLGDGAWACFAAAYAAHGAPPEALAAPVFWRLVASLAAAAIRLDLEAATPATFAPLERLAGELA